MQCRVLCSINVSHIKKRDEADRVCQTKPGFESVIERRSASDGLCVDERADAFVAVASQVFFRATQKTVAKRHRGKSITPNEPQRELLREDHLFFLVQGVI